MNVLTIGDIHNDVENIINYADKLSMLDFDVIVCPGDFTDVPPRGFTSVEIAKLIIEELRTFTSGWRKLLSTETLEKILKILQTK